MSEARIRLLFVDEGSYHHETVLVPEEVFGGYDRLIDALREDPEILKRTWVDVNRLCAAYRVGPDEDGDD
ncbi:MAG: hypothetical protein RQ745_06740 [Longimicrobiales bacterium]|nr:hypothetical protein [Longimicrobiales bacterium]